MGGGNKYFFKGVCARELKMVKAPCLPLHWLVVNFSACDGFKDDFFGLFLKLRNVMDCLMLHSPLSPRHVK